jgi:ABC-type nitrate/sulfonate/bicarbonate transport system substrate-binding protein
MNRRTLLALMLLSTLVMACGPGQPTAQAPAPGAKSGTMRVEVPADADVADIPWLAAVESLEAQGYTLETLSFSDTAIEVTAMEKGDLDISGINNQIAWAAISQGAELVTFMDRSANTFMTITSRDITACADLDGKSVAVPSAKSVSGAMFNAYVEQNCPGTEPQILVVSGGSNRRAALIAGEVDAAMQDFDDLIKLESERPGDFYALVAFGQAFPGLQINSQVVHRDFAEKNPEMVKDVIRAVFAARRALQDPQALSEAIVQYLEAEPDRAEQMAETYLAQGIWDASGVYSLESVQATLEFLREGGDLPPDLTAEDVADLSYYDAVVDEIGPP